MKRELTNQELLDRYIHAMMLPPDIAAEVRSNLESLIDDRGREVRRELRPEEVSAILKQNGHPMVVASRYREQPGRSLISPWFFPFYWFTVRAMLVGWLTIRVIIAIFVFQGTTPAGEILWKLGRDILLAAFFIPSGVTWIFAVWEYVYFKFRYWERWTPESLPPVPPSPKPAKQPRPAAQIIGQAVWIIFWAMALFLPGMAWVWGGRGVFSPSEAVYAMRLPLWLLALFGISQTWLGYTRFAEARWRSFLRITIGVAGMALAIFLLVQGNLLVAGPNWNATQAKPLATLNQMAGGVLVLACVFLALLCVHELRCFIRKSGRRLDTDHQVV